MKQLIEPFANGGAPIFNDDLLLLQNGGLNILKSMYEGNNAGSQWGLVISGCEVTDEGATFAVASGIVFINGLIGATTGEFYTVDAQAGLPKPFYIVADEASEVTEQRVFRDGNPQNIITLRKAEIKTTRSDAVNALGGYIPMVRPATKYAGWITYAQVGGTFSNGWTDSVLDNLKFRINPTGLVEWGGAVNGSASTSDVFAQDIALELFEDVIYHSTGGFFSKYGRAYKSDVTTLDTLATISSNSITNFTMSIEGANANKGIYNFHMSYRRDNQSKLS